MQEYESTIKVSFAFKFFARCCQLWEVRLHFWDLQHNERISRKMLINMGGDIWFTPLQKKFLSTKDKQKGDLSRMYGIALLWLIPDISPDAGMLRSGSPPLQQKQV